MPETSKPKGPFEWLFKLNLAATISTLAFVILLLGGLVALAMPTLQNIQGNQVLILITLGALWVFFVVISVLWMLLVFGMVRTQLQQAGNVQNAVGLLERLETLQSSQLEASRKIIELSTLSDQAKSLVYREQEVATLREIVHEDLMKQDYQTAESLIANMEKTLGYVNEAERLREEVAEARQATVEEKIDSAIQRVRILLQNYDWPRAIRSTERLIAMFPNDAKIAALPAQVEEARNKHKRKKLQEYGEAVRKNDVEKSIELLKELDRHLSPQEAAALQESARGVFRAKLHNLGVQFAISVTDERWEQAIITGEEIMRDYPNSRMSLEVQQKMPQLRARAAEAANPK